MKPLWDFQLAAKDRIKAAIADLPLFVCPTGGGKTKTAVAVVEELGVETIWCTHRRELVEQAVGELQEQGIRAGTIMAGRPYYPSRPVQVASVDTLRRRDGIRPPRLIVVDEAHHAVSKQFKGVIERYPDAWVLGLTATPFRLDGRGLGDVFGAIVEAPRAADLIAAGRLVEPRAYTPPEADLKGVAVSGGDFNRAQLAERYDRPKLIGDVIETWRRHADGYLTILFACNVAHSKHLAECFRAEGVPAEHVDAETPAAERAATLDRFRRRETIVLCNVALFTEGFNVPGVECVDIVRPTQSLCLHLQMIGRATRVCDGKRYPVVLDHAGNLRRHGRITRPIEYSLASGVVRQAAGAEWVPRCCPKCYRGNAPWRKNCIECGAAFFVGDPDLPDVAEGTLAEFTDELPPIAAPKPSGPTAAERQAFWDAAEAESAARGWQAMAVVARYQARFGKWPITAAVGGRRCLVHEAAADEVKAAYLAEMERKGREKGYKPGFAKARFREACGHWPRKVHLPRESGLFAEVG